LKIFQKPSFALYVNLNLKEKLKTVAYAPPSSFFNSNFTGLFFNFSISDLFQVFLSFIFFQSARQIFHYILFEILFVKN